MVFNNKYYRWLAELSLILIVIFAMRLWMQRDVVSDIAPNINALMLDGESFELYKFKERPVLVHFWATWCPVCKLEQSNIENISKDKPVITIAMQSGSSKEVSAYMKEEKIFFNVINDESGSLSQTYKIRGVPVSFIVGRENKIEFIEVGYTTEIGLRLRLWWASL